MNENNSTDVNFKTVAVAKSIGAPINEINSQLNQWYTTSALKQCLN